MMSLKNLCINLIVGKFERFYFAFTASNDKNLRLLFEFLQRKFSLELIKGLTNDRKLKDEYLDFLINKHLNYLNTKWLESSKYLYSTVDIFRRLPNLTRIQSRNCFNEVLKNVAEFCPNIVEIDINNSNVTDNGIQYLCEIKNGVAPCPKLKNIFLHLTGVTDIGVENLIRNLRSLEKIYHEDVPNILHSIRKENLSESENIQFNLIELEFFKPRFYRLKLYTNFTDVLTSCLTLCPKLETFICSILREEHLNLLSNRCLKNLHLEFEDRKANMDNFLEKNGGKLTCLNVAYCTLSVYILNKYCPNLKKFTGCNIDFRGNHDTFKLSFTSLTNCEFKDIESSSNKAVCLLLPSSPKLETIALRFCNISLEMKTEILNWSQKSCAKKITLVNDSFNIADEIEFLKRILSYGSSLEEMRLGVASSFWGPHERNIVENLKRHAENLPNKPSVIFEEFSIYR